MYDSINTESVIATIVYELNIRNVTTVVSMITVQYYCYTVPMQHQLNLVNSSGCRNVKLCCIFTSSITICVGHNSD